MIINVVFINVMVFLLKVVYFMNVDFVYRFDYIKVCLKYILK